MIKRYLIKVTHNNGAGVYYVGKDNIIVGSYGHIDGIIINKKVTENKVLYHGYKRAGNAKNNYIFSHGPLASAATSVEIVEITLLNDSERGEIITHLIDTIDSKEKEG